MGSIVGQYLFNFPQILSFPNSRDDLYENIRQMASAVKIDT